MVKVLHIVLGLKMGGLEKFVLGVIGNDTPESRTFRYLS